MKKGVVQALVSCAIFVMVLFGFAQIDWLSVLSLNDGLLEKKLGDMYWSYYMQQGDYIEDDELLLPIDSLVNHICEANGIEREEIKLHLLKTENVNAFALPDNHLVIHTALVLECKNEMELCGVLAHEIAHMQKGHVMRKLTKAVGLSFLLNVVGGNSSEAIAQTLHLLSSTAYDRSLESEADATAVDYLMNAGIDPEPFADFLLRLDKEENMPGFMVWVSTHPDSKARSEKVIDLSRREHKAYKQVLNIEEWKKLKAEISVAEESF